MARRCCGLCTISYKDKLFIVKIAISGLIMGFSFSLILIALLCAVTREALTPDKNNLTYDSWWLEASTITLLWIGMAPLAVLPYIHSGTSEDVGELLHLPCSFPCSFILCCICRFCGIKTECSKFAVCGFASTLIFSSSILYLFNFVIIGLSFHTYPEGSRDAFNTVATIIFGIGLFLYAEMIFDCFYGYGQVKTAKVPNRPRLRNLIKKSENKTLVFEIIKELFTKNRGSFYSIKMISSVIERDGRLDSEVSNNIVMGCMKAIPGISYREHQRSKTRIYGLKNNMLKGAEESSSGLKVVKSKDLRKMLKVQEKEVNQNLNDESSDSEDDDDNNNNKSFKKKTSFRGSKKVAPLNSGISFRGSKKVAPLNPGKKK